MKRCETKRREVKRRLVRWSQRAAVLLGVWLVLLPMIVDVRP